jgi:hypothetical protein
MFGDRSEMQPTCRRAGTVRPRRLGRRADQQPLDSYSGLFGSPGSGWSSAHGSTPMSQVPARMAETRPRKSTALGAMRVTDALARDGGRCIAAVASHAQVTTSGVGATF